MIRLQPENHAGEQTDQHDDRDGPGPDEISLLDRFKKLLAPEEVLRSARHRKIVAAPILLIQSMIVRPTKVKGRRTGKTCCPFVDSVMLFSKAATD